jgi:DNA-binding transcriptional ArsR family regulator
VEDAIKAIAAPQRREILRLVLNEELTAGAIAESIGQQTGVTRTAVSQHLKVLKDAGLLAERREGTRRLYRVALPRLAELRAYLNSFWDDQLTRLKMAAEMEERMNDAKARRRDPQSPRRRSKLQ